MARIRLVPEDVERLERGETVEVTIPGYRTPGRNTVIEISLAQNARDAVEGYTTDAVRLDFPSPNDDGAAEYEYKHDG